MERLRRIIPRVAAIGIAAAVLLYLPGGHPLATDEGVGGTPKVHTDASGLLQAAVDLSEALMREDLERVRDALVRHRRTTRQLKAEDRETIGPVIVNTDQAYWATLQRAEEAANVGDMDQVLKNEFWLHQACWVCHQEARKAGILPDGPLGAGTRSASPADSENPSRPSASRPSR